MGNHRHLGARGAPTRAHEPRTNALASPGRAALRRGSAENIARGACALLLSDNGELSVRKWRVRLPPEARPRAVGAALSNKIDPAKASSSIPLFEATADVAQRVERNLQSESGVLSNLPGDGPNEDA